MGIHHTPTRCMLKGIDQRQGAKRRKDRRWSDAVTQEASSVEVWKGEGSPTKSAGSSHRQHREHQRWRLIIVTEQSIQKTSAVRAIG